MYLKEADNQKRQIGSLYLQMLIHIRFHTKNIYDHTKSRHFFPRGENWTAVSCTGELHMAEFNSLANTILGMAEPTATIVCLTSRHVR